MRGGAGLGRGARRIFDPRKTSAVALVALAVTAATLANAETWHRAPGGFLGFSVTVETPSGAPLTLEGEVGSWTLLTLSFDPARPGAARVEVTFDMASLTTGRAVYDRDMATEEWLSVDRFPTATFTARGARRLDRDTYALSGDLRLRGHTVTLPVEFSLSSEKDGGVTVQGHARLDRRDFGIGTGARDGLVARGIEVTFRFDAVPDGGQKEESGQ